MNLSQIGQILRRRWRIIAACAVLGAIAGAIFAVASPAPYKSTIRMVVGTCGEGSVDQAYTCSMFADTRSSTYLSLLNGPTLADAVIKDLKLDTTPEALAGRLKVVAEQQSAVFEITAEDSNAEQAQAIVVAAAKRATTLIAKVERPSSAQQPLIGASRVGDASPATRDGRSIPAVTGIALLAGLLVGVIVAVVRDQSDPTITCLDDLARVSDLPILAGPGDNAGRLGRRLRNALLPRLPDGQSSVVVVSGIGDQESSSAVADGLATALADGDRKVVLISANPERANPERANPERANPEKANSISEAATLARPAPAATAASDADSGAVADTAATDLAESPTEVTSGQIPEQIGEHITDQLTIDPAADAESTGTLIELLSDVDRTIPLTSADPYLRIASGRSPAAESSAPGQVRRLVDRLREQFDYVVIDGTDIDTNDLAETFAACADVTAVTVLKGSSSRRTLGDELSRLPRIGASVAGIVYADSPIADARP